MNELFITNYIERLFNVLKKSDWSNFIVLADHMMQCWKNGHHVFLCGNGGSAGNAMHLANDFLYGIAKKTGNGLNITALPANSAVITCLANDVGYEYIYSEQLAVLGKKNDLLITLSGSGNSPNVLKAIQVAKNISITSFAILGLDGGEAKKIADYSIHFPIDDMQISEDIQIILGHILMQYMYTQKNLDNL